MAENGETPTVVVEQRSSGIAPFIWGALIGAGIALLYAPRSGRKTRKEIADGAQRLRESTEDTVRRTRESVAGSIEDVREQIRGRVDSARMAMDKGREAARSARADLERKVQEAAGPEPVPNEYDGERHPRRGHPYTDGPGHVEEDAEPNETAED